MSSIDTSSNPSLNEIVSSLAARVNKQHDTGFMDELKHIVNYKRSKALYVWMLKLPMRDYLSQTFVVDTERVPATECEEFPTDCYIVRTVCTVPSPFRDPRIKMPYEMFDYVGHSSGYMPYGYVKREFLDINRYKKYTSSNKKWFYSGGYIYIINDKTTPTGNPLLTDPIMVRGVFQDPISDKGCNICDESGVTCTPDTAPYPVPPELLDEIVNAIIREELRMGDVPKEIDEDKDTIKVDSIEQIQHVNT